MQKKVIIALLVSIPILFGVFYFAVDGPSSIENDAEKLAVYAILMQDRSVIKNPEAIQYIKGRVLKIESKYKLEEQPELIHLMEIRHSSLLLDLDSESGELQTNPLLHRFLTKEIENINKILEKHSK